MTNIENKKSEALSRMITLGLQSGNHSPDECG